MHGVGAAEAVDAGLGQAEVTDLALAHELGHGADGVLDGRFRVHTMLIIEVNDIGAQAAQAGLAGGADVLGPAVDAANGGVRLTADEAELGGEGDLVAPAGDGAADELLVFEGAVHVGGVEKGDAVIQRIVNGGDGFLVVAPAVKVRHAHAAEAEWRNDEALGSEFAVFHINLCRTTSQIFSIFEITT